MLAHLRIKNLAIAEDLSIDFGEGLNVITGETGAGKSLLVQALNLVLGERADKSMIRSGESRCVVEVVFRLPDTTGVDAVLNAADLEPCDDGQFVVRRVVAASGSGRNFINDCPTTLTVMKAAGDRLVDLHGPHDHQSLFDREFQLQVLDAFGHTGKQVAAYTEPYRVRLELERQRQALEGDDGDTERQLDMLAYQIDEIEAADLSEADDTELEEELTRVANASRIVELASGVCAAMTEDDGAAFNALVGAQPALRELADLLGEEARGWQEEAESLTVQLQELSATIAGTAQNVESDPGRLQWLEDRKALVHKLQRKYGGSSQSVHKFLETARARHEELSSRGERLAAIEREVAARDADVQKAGKALSRARRKAADKLAAAITSELQSLGFARGEFRVDLSPATTPQPSGLDVVEFGFAPNVGEEMRPLRAIASSGEISRVMLATKSVLATHDRIPVLVFDEVDANLGGTTGHDVGAKLSAVARTHQVLCITHLPQVAAHGDTHLVVSKRVASGRTRTEISHADGRERVEEVARMLGGRDLTSVTLKHAEEMLAAPGKTGC